MKKKVVIDAENQGPAIAEFIKVLLSAGEVTIQQGDALFSVRAVRTAVSEDGRKFLTDGGPQ